MRTLPEGVASKPRMLETPYASNSWAHGCSRGWGGCGWARARPKARAHGPTCRQGVIPAFTLPDTLEKNFVGDLASKSSKLAETRNFRYNRSRRSYQLKGFGLKWPMCRDRCPEMCQNLVRFCKKWSLGGAESGSLDFVRAQEWLGYIQVDLY